MEKKLWTPGGEVPVGSAQEHAHEPSGPAPSPGSRPPAAGGPGPAGAGEPGMPTEEALKAELEMLAQVPVGSIVLQYASTLLTVAQLHLAPGELEESQLALDVLTAVVDAAGDRVGAAAPQLREVLSQVQMMFVEATRLEAEAAGRRAGDAGGTGGGDDGGSDAVGAAET